MQSSAILAFLETNWGWSAGLAASMLALTALASTLMNPSRKDEIALWLMGAQGETSWSRSFVWLFDSVFGERHLSWHCFFRSAVASLLAVVLIWLLIGGFDNFRVRVQSELSLGGILVIALAVNVLADYVSLLETRWLLGMMHRLRSPFLQLGVLAFDLLVSAAIIWFAIVLYLNSALHEGKIDSFAEVLGIFSVFSVIFYSTFLTSVWTWAYILSTWVLRLFSKLQLTKLLDVEHKPIIILGHVLALLVFVASLVVAVPMQKDEHALSIADRALCSFFKGQICLDVAKLTTAEQAQLDLILLACEGGATEECVDFGLKTSNTKPEDAVRLFTVACNNKNSMGCNNLGVLFSRGYGVNLDQVKAAELYSASCEQGNGLGCGNLGFLYETGMGVDKNPAEAARLYLKGCEGGGSVSCNNLGHLYSKGSGVDLNLEEAARLFRIACDRGSLLGCSNLGYLYFEGIGLDKDLLEAKKLYQMSCDEGEAVACANLGYLYEQGIGMVHPDLSEAAKYYRIGCEGAAAFSCTNLGILHQRGHGVDIDLIKAASLYRLGCEGGDAGGCTNLGAMYEKGVGVDLNVGEATQFYTHGCALGLKTACELKQAISKN